MGPCCDPSTCLLYFECDLVKMEERMVERSKTSGRSDDNPETIKKRLDTFAGQTKPIIDYFNKQNKVVTVNADSDIETVFAEVTKQMNERIIKKSDRP